MTDKTPAMTELPDGATVLPDGSAFAIASFPLPANHWLYAPREYRDGEEDPIELPSPILSHQAHGDVVRAAIRYAVRGATMCGKEPDFDPDALVQNAMYALCGPFGGAALQSAQPSAAVSDEAARLAEQLSNIANGVRICGVHDRHFVSNRLHEIARAILALRPAAVPMTDEVFDLICNAIDKADTISMEGDYMLDSDDCIAVVRVMQALLSAHHGITAQAKKETP